MLLAIDPGLNATGYCVINKNGEIHDIGTIRPKGNFVNKVSVIGARLRKIAEDCKICIIEEPAPNWTRYNVNHKSLMLLQQLITRIIMYLAPIFLTEDGDYNIKFINADEISKPHDRHFDRDQDLYIKIELAQKGYRTSEHARDAYRLAMWWLQYYGFIL